MYVYPHTVLHVSTTIRNRTQTQTCVYTHTQKTCEFTHILYMCTNTEGVPLSLEASVLEIKSQRRWNTVLDLVSKNVESLK